MICDVCKKNPAKLHITQIVSDKKFSLHICPACANEKGITGPSINTSFSVEQFLTGAPAGEAAQRVDDDAQKTCPSCGLSYNAFKESGRLGCSRCYDTFSVQLKPLIQKMQKEMKHLGKIPDKGNERLILKRDISELRLQLKDAVSQEHFEMAAQLRDQIRRLEADLGDFEG